MIVRDLDDDAETIISVSFAPIMNEEDVAPTMFEMAEGYQVSETQTSSNVLRVGVRAKQRPASIQGKLRGRAAPGGMGNASAGAGTPAVYDALFDEESNVEFRLRKRS